MSFEIFASPGKGRTALETEKVAALIDHGHIDGEVNTVAVLVTGSEVVLGTKFKTVLKKFAAADDEEE